MEWRSDESDRRVASPATAAPSDVSSRSNCCDRSVEAVVSSHITRISAPPFLLGECGTCHPLFAVRGRHECEVSIMVVGNRVMKLTCSDASGFATDQLLR